jgi:hypothetical protein
MKEVLLHMWSLRACTKNILEGSRSSPQFLAIVVGSLPLIREDGLRSR